MIQGFRNQGSADIFSGLNSREARTLLPRDLWPVALRKLVFVDKAKSIGELSQPPSNHLEQLRGERSGEHGIRINDKYRICFVWTEEGPTAVEVCDYH